MSQCWSSQETQHRVSHQLWSLQSWQLQHLVCPGAPAQATGGVHFQPSAQDQEEQHTFSIQDQVSCWRSSQQEKQWEELCGEFQSKCWEWILDIGSLHSNYILRKKIFGLLHILLIINYSKRSYIQNPVLSALYFECILLIITFLWHCFLQILQPFSHLSSTKHYRDLSTKILVIIALTQ